MIYHICSNFFFLKHFLVSIGLNFYWSLILEALLEMKKKNTKCATKCSQYNVIMTVIDKFQQLNVHPLYFLLLAWAAFPGYGNVCFAFPVPCWAIPLERWQCLFIFSLCVIALCMMYVYLYMLVYG